MVNEMRSEREARTRPRLVPLFEYDANVSSHGGRFYVENLGKGAALNVDVTLKLEPSGTSSRWVSPILRPGERRKAFNPLRQDFEWTDLQVKDKWAVTLKGRCEDV